MVMAYMGLLRGREKGGGLLGADFVPEAVAAGKGKPVALAGRLAEGVGGASSGRETENIRVIKMVRRRGSRDGPSG
jgi:hypothetical protein